MNRGGVRGITFAPVRFGGVDASRSYSLSIEARGITAGDNVSLVHYDKHVNPRRQLTIRAFSIDATVRYDSIVVIEFDFR